MSLHISPAKDVINEGLAPLQNVISLRHFLPPDSPAWQRGLAGVLDSLTGIRQLNRLYKQHQFAGLAVVEFLTKLREVMHWDIGIAASDLGRIPKSGPLILVANHPYGGLEGVLLASLLTNIRSDVRILANQALQQSPVRSGTDSPLC